MTKFLDFMPIFVPCGISFASDWHYYHSKTPWTEDIMRDPLKRVEMKKKQMITQQKMYPEIFAGMGEDFYEEGTVQEIDESKINPNPNLGFGVATVPSFFGAPTKFDKMMDPIALPIIDSILDGDPMNLKKPDLETSMQWLMEEIDILINAGYSKQNIGQPDMQGPLNIAMRLIGDNRMMSLIANPKKESVVRHVLNVCKETYIESVKNLRRALGKPEQSNFSVSGCTYYYISPKSWLKYMAPLILEMRERLGEVRLHHCGEANHARIDAYSQIEFREVEFGFGTDIQYVRNKFIHPKLGPVHISCRISPYRMLNQPAEVIKKDAEFLITGGKGGPMNISVVGVAYNTPDENIKMLWNTINDYNRKRAEEEDDFE